MLHESAAKCVITQSHDKEGDRTWSGPEKMMNKKCAKKDLLRTPILVIICGTWVATPIQLRGRDERRQSGSTGIMRKTSQFRATVDTKREVRRHRGEG
jgi:hypothetical protein